MTDIPQVMRIQPGHWAWLRERPEHHGGAIRAYKRDPEDDGYPRGPYGTPYRCSVCDSMVDSSQSSGSEPFWTSFEMPLTEDKEQKTTKSSNFNLDGTFFFFNFMFYISKLPAISDYYSIH